MSLSTWLYKRRRGPALVVLGALVATGLTASPAQASANLLVNPGLQLLTGGFPSCFKQAGWGTSTFSYTVVAGRNSSRAMSLAVTAISSGDRKMLIDETAACAPNVTPGHQYDLSTYFKSTTTSAVITVFRHDVALGWQYWTDLSNLTLATGWTQKLVRTPQVPPNTDQITWGVTVYGVGTVVTDDYSMVDVTAPTTGNTCSAGVACTKGTWQVMPYTSPARAMHAVVLHNGNVLLVAGSGNSETAFDAGSFATAVYQPYSGTFVNVPTPADLFCSGHVQLSDGRVLVMGGNKDYPSADGTVGYQGLKESYIYDPATNAYTRINDLNAGHWYPSATALGNGDVLSLGGLGENSEGTVATEYYSEAQDRWLNMNEANQTWRFWGLYPTMVLMQDGRLFYTGSHTFGNNLPGTGASIYNYATGAVTDVPGLRNKDERDQSASVLLPPAQAQKVATFGGGNNESNPEANRLVDIIDLKAANPTYVPGPDIPLGTLTGGVPQTGAQGKMYVSAVILPDGKVFETGGAMHNRADPVFEASMYNPVTNTFASMAADPMSRGYHSTGFLLPDGRVMAFGDNPGDGSYATNISIYSPPYLFNGPRPQIDWVASNQWAYGTTNQITVNGPVTKASLIRPAAVTHSSDPNQRYVELPMTVNGNSIGLNLTSNPNIAPPGWYMLFVTNAAGTPSVAKWVHVG